MNRFGKLRDLLLFSLIGGLFIGCDVNFTMVDGYSFDFTGQKSEKSESGAFHEGIQEIEVENRFGDIKVILAANEEPGWSWDAAVWGDSAELSAALLEDTFLDIQTVNGKQIWKLMLPEAKRDLNGVSSNLMFRVPAGMRVRLQNSHGNLDISGLDGTLDAENSHGSVSLLGLSGNCSVENSHGNLSAKNIAAATLKVFHGNTSIGSAVGNVRFEGAHGDVVAEDIDGDLLINVSHMGVEVSRVTQAAKIITTHNQVKVDHVAGELSIENQHGDIEATEIVGNVILSNAHGNTKVSTSGDIIDLKSQHGSLDIDIENPNFQSIQAETSFDDISLGLPTGVRASINMTTTHGETDSELESDSDSSQSVVLFSRHGDIRIRTRDTWR